MKREKEVERDGEGYKRENRKGGNKNGKKRSKV